jgi:hypothetical protein
MKYTLLLAIIACISGCHHSEFDVSSDQVAKRIVSKGGPGGGIPDLNHLPPGAVKHEYHFKKGDRLPDGTIADGDRKMVTVEASGPGGPGAPKGARTLTTDTRIEAK